MKRRVSHQLWQLLLLLGICAVAVFARVWQFRESLWLDELHTAWVVAGPFVEISDRAQIGNQSPLYFWLVAGVRSVLGAGDWVIRLPSLAAGLAFVPAVAAVVLRWTASPTAALVAAGLVAVDHHCIFYSQEARPYALLQLVALWHIYAFHRVQQAPTPSRRATAIALGAVLFWLHYTAALLFLADAAWYLWLRLRRGTKFSGRILACDTLLLAVCMLPAVPQVIEIGSRRNQWSFVAQSPLWRAVEWFSLIPLVLIPLALAAVAARVQAQNRSAKSRRAPTELWALTICWFAVPVTFAWLLTWLDVTRLFFPRYLAASIAAPILLAGLAVGATSGQVLRRIAAIAILVLAGVHSDLPAQFMRDGRLLAERNEDWRGAIRWLNDRAASRPAPLFLRSGLIEADQLSAHSSSLLQDYSILPVLGCYRLENSLDVIPLPTAKRIQLQDSTLADLRRHGSAWLLINGRSETRSRAIGEFTQSAREGGLELVAEELRRFRNVAVVHLRAAAPK